MKFWKGTWIIRIRERIAEVMCELIRQVTSKMRIGEIVDLAMRPVGLNTSINNNSRKLVN